MSDYGRMSMGWLLKLEGGSNIPLIYLLLPSKIQNQHNMMYLSNLLLERFNTHVWPNILSKENQTVKRTNQLIYILDDFL